MAPAQDNEPVSVDSNSVTQQQTATPPPPPPPLDQPLSPEPAVPPSTDQPMMTASSSGSGKMIGLILLVLTLVATGVVALLILGQKLPFFKPAPSPSPSPVLVSPSPTPIVSPSASGSATPSASAKAKASGSPTASPLALTKSCQNDTIKTSAKYPSTWTCKSETPSTANGTLTLTSSLFELVISNLGRSAPCEADSSQPNYNSDCKFAPFFSNSVLSVDLYTLKGEAKEIYGRLKTGATTSPSVAIKYTNMATRQLTADQKAELVSVLEAVSIIK